MNAFYEHHKNSIEFRYRCFDRLLLNGVIQPFQQPERVLGFFNAYRGGRRVTHRTLAEIADQYVYWLRNRSEKWGAPIVEAPEEQRRDDFVLPYLKDAEPDRVAVILKGREPARILVAIGGKDNDSPHLEYKQRWFPGSSAPISARWNLPAQFSQQPRSRQAPVTVNTLLGNPEDVCCLPDAEPSEEP